MAIQQESHNPERQMSSKGTNLFAQIIDLVDRATFARIVHRHGAERCSKGFGSWDQFVSMMFCQLGKAQSLREICGGLATSQGKLQHLGLKTSPKRSTLAYANEHRPWQVFEDFYYATLKRSQSAEWASQGPGGLPRKRFRFKSKLFSLDATFIDLCLSAFPWAHFRRAKGAVKLHLLLDHDGYLPSFVCISDGKGTERKITREAVNAELLVLPAGSIVVFDRGYTDFDLFAQWHAQGITFVTRLMPNAAYTVRERFGLPQYRKNILADQRVRYTGPITSVKYPHDLRRIVLYDQVNEQKLEFLTNNFDLGPTTIAAIYKDRWQIELFFKALKQSMKIKTFVGTSPNALKTQIWTALLAMLLLKMLKARSRFAWSLSNLVAMLRFNLFSYRDLLDWLNAPYEPPPVLESAQLTLPGF
jgi:hypothetical protein